MQLYLVRHPQPVVARGVCYGISDVSCSHDALESAATDLWHLLPKGLEIICSPLSRCEQLAQYLCRHSAQFSYRADERLAEMHFGAWEMQAWNQIPHAELAAWTADFANYRCGGTGQSVFHFLRRIAARLNESLQAGQDQIWITHAGVIRALQWLGQQPATELPALMNALTEHSDCGPALFPLRAADWPAGELAFGRIQTWCWPLPPS